MGFRIGHFEWPTTGHADVALSAIMLKHGIPAVTVTEADMRAAERLSIRTGDDSITFSIEDSDVMAARLAGAPASERLLMSADPQGKPTRAAMIGAALTIGAVLVGAGLLLAPLVIRLWTWAL